MYAYFVLFIFTFFLGGLLVNLSRSVCRRESKHDYIVRSALLLICATSFLVGPMIFGLEYEDAYIHSAAARFIGLDPATGTDGFYIKLCAVGSLIRCSVEVTYGTQLIGFSSLLFPWSLWYPGATHIASAASAVASALTLQIYWSFIRRLRCALWVKCAGLVLLLATPGYYLIAGSAFAEPVYTLYFTALTLYGIDLFFEDDPNRPAMLTWVILISGSFLLVMTKREGLLLICLFLVTGIVLAVWRVFRKQEVGLKLLVFVGLCTVAAAFSIFVVDIWEGAVRHSHDIHAAAFSVKYFGELFPVIAAAATNPLYFGSLGIASTLAAPIVIFKHEKRGILSTIIILAYALIYSMHARHKGFLIGNPVHPEEMARYLFTLSPIAAAMCTYALSEVIPNRHKQLMLRRPSIASGIAISFAGVIIFLGLYQSVLWKRNIWRDEQRRFEAKVESGELNKEGQPILVSPYSANLYAILPFNTFIIDSRFSGIPTKISP
jgi:hypothetical protein